MSNNTKGGITSGLIWAFGERITAQLVSTIVTIILARILDPENYGIISIVTVFISICNVFVTSGLGSAIVQKKEVDSLDYNTAFIISFIISLIMYLVLFLISPYIANFYDMQELVLIIRVMGLRLPVASINTIQQAHIRREMAFKRFFIATLFGTIISGVIGIVMAIKGFGVWALVFQYLTNTTVDTLILCFVSGWIPKFQFSIIKCKEIFSFGWKVLATELVYTLEGDIRSLLIGKVFGSSDLAYYDQGKKYPALLVNNINSSISKVMLPAYSREQNNIFYLKQMLRKSIIIGIYILAPILIGFAIVSQSFVETILGEKWLFCVPYIQIYCISYLTRPLETACHQAILAIGRSDIVLYIMIIIHTIALGTVCIAVFIFKSVMLIAWGSLLSTFISLLCFMACVSKLIGYKIKEQIQDILPTLLICSLMGIVVYLIGCVNINANYILIIQIIIGIILYLLFSVLFKIQAYNYLMSILEAKIGGKYIYKVKELFKLRGIWQ